MQFLKTILTRMFSVIFQIILKIFNIIKFVILLRIEKNNIMRAVISKKNYNKFFYFFFLFKKSGLYRK